MKIGIFGGTFNPVHYGHLRAAEEVRERLNLNRILFIPSKKPPLKTKGIAQAKHRYEMLKIALLDNSYFELSDIEFRLKGKSYSVKTIEVLKKSNPEKNFSMIVGIDTFLEIPKWWHPEKLVSLIDFIIISRPNFRFLDLQASPYIKIKKKFLKELDEAKIERYETELPTGVKVILLRLTPIGISSTEIRNLLTHGKSVKYLLPADVKSYIILNKIYKFKN